MQWSHQLAAVVRSNISSLLCLSLVLTGSLGIRGAVVRAQSEPSGTAKVQVADHIRAGDRFYADAKYEAAIESYTQALGLYKLHGYAYYQRANAYRKLENYEAAVKDYSLALRINPDNRFAYQYRGFSLAAIGQPAAAITDYNEVIRRHPKDAKTYHRRGDAHAALDDRQAAITDYEKAKELYKEARNFRAQSQIQKLIRAVKRKRQ